MHLPVLQPAAAPLDERTARELRARLSPHAQVRTGRHDRLLYATDASMYQVEPLGVVIPGDEADVVAAVEYCHEHGLAILPRGGGTSLAGQCTNRAVVIDASAGLKAVGPIDFSPKASDLRPSAPSSSTLRVPFAATVYAQAGVTIDDLNTHVARQCAVRPIGTPVRAPALFYAPDPATTAQATVGGCIGNNAAGGRSVLYGRTVDSVAHIDAVLVSGARVRFGPGAGRHDPVALKLADGVARIVRAHADLIRERYPKTLRRNAGYALDMILQQLDAGTCAEDLDLVPLLCGSEGTLAVTLGAVLRLVPAPGAKSLALLSFESVDDAIAAVPTILSTSPSAVELIDDVVIEAARGNRECSPFVDAFPTISGQDPAAVLFVEHHAPSVEALHAAAGALRAVLTLPAERVRTLTDAGGMADAWRLRKAGEPLLHGLPGLRKPITFIEDNAVPVENLARFVRDLRAIVESHGTRAAFWAHASVGVLHVRPMLNPHDPADLERLRDIAVRAADLAKACGGVMSGEHGDGRVRGPLLERFYGPVLLHAFAQVKALFDPRGLLNPGNIVSPGDIASITRRTRIEPATHASRSGPARPASTFFDFADQTDLTHAAEMCSGAGVCRKSSGGVMCPSYRATLDERHSTRGRGNALRLAITGQLDGPHPPEVDARWSDPGTIETLDLCLSCKACKTECPSNVDIARLKAEYTAQRFMRGGRVPVSALLTGHVRTLNRLGSIAPGLANFTARLRPARALINRVMNLHPSRSLPSFSKSLYRLWPRGRVGAQPGAPRVALFADCFTTYNESRIGLASRRVLMRLGYAVDLARTGCCGRSMISVGMLPQAIDTIDATIEQLRPAILDPSVRAILFAEPSCLSAVKDEWLQLRCTVPLSLRTALAAKAMLIEEFIERDWSRHPVTPSPRHPVADNTSPPVIFHAHCHQKALWGHASSSSLLARLLGPRLRVPDTGCCGMAGSFGYDRDKFGVSMRIANLDGVNTIGGGGVMPHVREALNADPCAITLATGTSCRHQIKDASGGAVHARHPIELIDDLLG